MFVLPWWTAPSQHPTSLQGKYAEADRLYLRAIEIGEKTLGPDHPDLAKRLNNRAGLLGEQVRAVRKFVKCFMVLDVYFSGCSRTAVEHAGEHRNVVLGTNIGRGECKGIAMIVLLVVGSRCLNIGDSCFQP